MARKIYFDPRSNGIGKLLIANGFIKGIELEPDIGISYIRSKLEVRQEDGKVYLISHSRKEYMVFDKLLFGMDLKDFIKTGILPGNKNQIKKFPITE